MVTDLKSKLTQENISIFLFVLMIWAYLAKMGLFNTIGAVAALFGMYIFACNRLVTFKYLKESRFLYLFLLIWVPIVFSAVLSVEPQDSWRVVVNILRFCFIGVLAILLTQSSLEKIKKWVLIFIILISVDAIFEWLLGYHLLGKIRDPSRIRGLFERYPIGYFMGTIALVIIYQAYSSFISKNKWKYVWVLLALSTVLTVFVAGSRAGWISLSVGIGFLFLWALIQNRKNISLKKMSAAAILTVVLCAAILQVPIVKARFINPNQSASLEVGSYEWFDRLSSNRFVLWQFAWQQFEDNPILGAGAGSFENQFSSQPAELKHGHGKAHFAHFFGLEVLAATGLLGFICYIVMLSWIFKMIIMSKEFPVWLVVAFVAMMPINMHNALYSSFWAMICWVSLILGLRERYLLMQKDPVNA